jgi:mRNA-degrading endonuclease HigB of HigAB toxin-antitoxin module
MKDFWARHPQAEGPIRARFAIAAKARWAIPAEIKRQFGGTVDFVGDNRVIFDLGGNKYRLVVHVSFTYGWPPARLASARIRHPDQKACPHHENGLEAASRLGHSGGSAARAAADARTKVGVGVFV